MSNENFQEIANRYAESSIQDMREELERLEHAQNCDGEDYVGEPCEHKDDPDWHDEDSILGAIWDSPLSLLVREDWHIPRRDDNEITEYELLLGTGGPGARIRGELQTRNV